MKKAFGQVTEFHKTYGQNAPESPTMATPDVLALRDSLILEEYLEYQAAVIGGDLIQIADALCDLTYVVLGTAVAHGLTRFDEMFDEVHRSNMSKLGEDGYPIRRADGKVLKGPNWSPPRLEPFL